VQHHLRSLSTENLKQDHEEEDEVFSTTYQFPKRVIFADGNIYFNAAGTFPEKAGRTEKKSLHALRVLSNIHTRGKMKVFGKIYHFTNLNIFLKNIEDKEMLDTL
jgi:hypothetical protein